jgi:hypothetical protein
MKERDQELGEDRRSDAIIAVGHTFFLTTFASITVSGSNPSGLGLLRVKNLYLV